MVRPILDQYWLTSTYGMRDDPLGKRGYRMHKGTDLAAATGSNVYSPVDGKIAYKRVDPGGWGNYVGVIEPDGTIRQFAHLSDMSLLDVGAEVRAGDVIGLAGSTGGSTGPHVDYMMFDKDGGLHNPEVADESLYRAFGQFPRPRLDPTPRPIDPNRQEKVGTGAATGGNIFKGIKAGPAEFASAGIQAPNSGAGPLKVVVNRGLLGPEIEDPMMPSMPQPQMAPVAGQPQTAPMALQPQMAQPVSAQPMAGRPLIAPPQSQPRERSFLDRAIDFAGNVGAPLQQIGQGVALLEGDFQSAQALGQMVEGNRKREQMKAKERAAVKMLTDMGYSQDQAAGIVASGNVDTLLNAAVKQKFSGANAPAKAREIEYLMRNGMSYEEAYKTVYGVSGAGGSGGYRTMSAKAAKEAGLLDAGMQIRDDAIVQIGKTGKIDVLSEGNVAPSLTEGQAKIFDFGTRMLQNSAVINEIEKEGTGFLNNFLDNVPLGNYMQSPQYQAYRQASQNWLAAALRKESGAAISPAEYEAAAPQYFPQPGDSAEVIKNKRSLRESVEKNFFMTLPSYYKENFYDNFIPLPFSTGLPSGEGEAQPAAEQPVASQPAVEQPAASQPVAEQPPASFFTKAFSKELTAAEREEAIQMWNEMSDEQRSQYQ